MYDLEFRVWDNTFEQFLEFNVNTGHWTACEGDPNVEYTYLELFVLKNDRFVVEQKLSEVDSSGNPIYTGDIVYLEHLENTEMDEVGAFELFNLLFTGKRSSVGNVMGNIHQNPDLVLWEPM